MSARALAGVRVVEIAGLPLAFAGRYLADLGAEVILVEPPDGAPTRGMGPFLGGTPGVERSFPHLSWNANKRSVVLDPASEPGGDTFKRLIASADVLLESAPVAERSALGLDHEALLRRRPDLVHVSATPFGPNGEWKHWKANDGVACAASGLAWLCGERRGPPVLGSGHPAYSLTSLAAVTAVMLALRARESGGSAHVELSLQECAAAATLQSATPTFWSWFGRLPTRPALSNAIRCADGGWVGLLVRPASFEGFRAWVEEAGTPTRLASEDAHWAELYAPREGNPVSAAVRELAERFDRDVFADRAAEAQTICLPVMDFPSMSVHPQFSENAQFLEIEHAPLGVRLGVPRSPADALEGEVPITRAPLLGEHDALLESLDQATPRKAAPPVDPSRILEGVRVVDFGWVLAGPIGTRILASFGAEVIRVESSRHADGMRSQPGPSGDPHPDLGGLFNSANAGKLSLTVDLTTERGRALVEDLIARADVVSNNFRPGALERMGFGYRRLRELRDDIVLLNLPGTHRAGPWSQRPTTGNVVMAASGLNLLMGFPGDPPRGYGVAYPDFTSPFFLATAILAALRVRDREGHGQELDLSQLSATVSMLGPEWMAYHATREQPTRAANRAWNFAPHGVFRTRDEAGWCALAVGSDAEWAALCELMGRAELAADSRFASHEARKRNEDELDTHVAEFAAAFDRWELARRLQGVGIAAAPVENLEDTFERDPQLRDRTPRLRHPSAPEVEMPVDREAIQFAGYEPEPRRGPILGEHNEWVVRELLGRSEEEYVSLVLDEILV